MVAGELQRAIEAAQKLVESGGMTADEFEELKRNLLGD